MMTAEEIGAQFKALGDVTRLRILALLSQREYCNCELVDIFGISQPAISRHMARLKEARLIFETRRGQWIYYRLNAAMFALGQGLEDLLKTLCETDSLVRQALLHPPTCSVPELS
ncbi:MAG: metalloregulator ArsR/SmtB family transcription factor [Sulfobacillus thermotolerans]|nr:metalloregulator ArsR/SmtB family transcription factor [Sulfobacillus thermotolerans]